MNRRAEAKRAKEGARILRSVVDYLYGEAQHYRTLEDQVPIKLALAICGAVRRGEENPFVSACYAAFGKTLDNYRRMRMKEKFQQAYELRKCIPDFDPEAVPAGGRDMDSTPSQRAVPTPIRQEGQRKQPTVRKQVGTG